MHVDSPQGTCRFGIARTDITPPLDIYFRMWGAARGERATGVHRPLLATVVVFQSAEENTDDSMQILVALDHCLLGTEEMRRLLARVTQKSGVSSERIEVVFSHTHAAGLMSLDRVELPGGRRIPPYLDELADRVAGLVVEAQQSLQSASIVYRQGRCDLAAHRDFWDNEAQQFVCGFNPSKTADDTLLVARVHDRSGNTLATLVNYACHPTTLAWQNTQISSDYPGAMREVVEQSTGAPCIFLQGASGELGPQEGFVGETEVADRNGRRLGFAVLSTLESLPPPLTRFQYTGSVVSGATLAAWAHVPLADDARQQKARWRLRKLTVELPYRDDLPSIEEMLQRHTRWQEDEESARNANDEDWAADCRAHVERCTRWLARLKTVPSGETFPYRVALWQIGDGCWITVEGEPYNDLQRNLRARMSGMPLFVCTLAHGSRCWYLPPAGIYGQGIYQEENAILAPGSLETLTDAISDALEEMLKA